MTFFDSQLLFVCDQLSLKILDINDAAISKLGYSKKELLGRKLSFLGKSIDLESDEFKALELPLIETWKLFSKEKEEIFVQFSSHLISYEGIPSKVVVGHDLTEVFKKNISKDRSLSLPIGFQDFPLAEIEWNLDHKIIRWSKRAEYLFGYSANEVEKSPHLLENIITDDDLKKLIDANKSVLKSNKSSQIIKLKGLTKDGFEIECEWYNSYLKNEKGEINSIYSVIKDITEEKIALRRSEQLMSNFLDLYNSISDAIYLVDHEGRIINANQGLTKTFGYKPVEVVGKEIKFLSANGKFSEQQIAEYLERARAGESVSYEGWGQKKNGEVIPTEVLMNEGTFLDNDVVIIVERDISDRLLSHRELKHRESMFSNLFHASPIGIARLDHHAEIKDINKSFEDIFGYTKEEVFGLELDKLIVPEEEYQEATKLSTSEIAKVYTGKRRTKYGNVIDVIVCAVPVIVDGEIIAMYGIYVDITDRKQAERKLKSNLREKEVLLAEIHHRVKNNLAVITGLLELQALNSDNSDAEKVLKDSQMRVNSIALVHELLYQSEDFAQVDIRNYIKELALVIAKTVSEKSVQVHFEFNLEEVFLEITNAIPCGLILNEVLTNSFKHAFRDRTAGNIKISFLSHLNKYIFRIEDDGIGLPEQKNDLPKRSLGMTLIKTLGKQLNAEVNIVSEKGTSFEFIFDAIKD